MWSILFPIYKMKSRSMSVVLISKNYRKKTTERFSVKWF